VLVITGSTKAVIRERSVGFATVSTQFHPAVAESTTIATVLVCSAGNNAHVQQALSVLSPHMHDVDSGDVITGIPQR
jgi:hypothetical protein